VGTHVTVEDNIPAFIDSMNAKAERAVAITVGIIERKAVDRAPFQFGFLRNSIGSHADGRSGVCYADAWYALYQEGKPYERHFLETSLNETVPQIPAILKGV
jgi:hypothetical protein